MRGPRTKKGRPRRLREFSNEKLFRRLNRPRFLGGPSVRLIRVPFAATVLETALVDPESPSDSFDP